MSWKVAGRLGSAMMYGERRGCPEAVLSPLERPEDVVGERVVEVGPDRERPGGQPERAGPQGGPGERADLGDGPAAAGDD